MVSEHKNATVLLCGNAAGELLPELYVLPYQRVPTWAKTQETDGPIITTSASGWMSTDIFYEFVTVHFPRFVREKNIPTPVFLFADMHYARLSTRVIEACRSSNVILYCLPPNSTAILQPLDVAVIRPIKEHWRSRQNPHLRGLPNEKFVGKIFKYDTLLCVQYIRL